MKLLLDAHLPAILADCFRDCDVLHTSQMPFGNLTTDQDINQCSINDQRILFTKDSDFYYSFIAKRIPYKLVLIKLGNMHLRDLISYFQRNAVTIVQLLQSNDFLIVEPDRIRILA
ncbi:MAG: DUF5615 family PIN-like protein [Chitinophagaceae bacterium]|nr:DUF5615 family PIN-like protein [Chitinophagaceae bacterium]